MIVDAQLHQLLQLTKILQKVKSKAAKLFEKWKDKAELKTKNTLKHHNLGPKNIVFDIPQSSILGFGVTYGRRLSLLEPNQRITYLEFQMIKFQKKERKASIEKKIKTKKSRKKK